MATTPEVARASEAASAGDASRARDGVGRLGAPELPGAAAAARQPEAAAGQALESYLAEVACEPYRYDLFQVLRRVEALTPHLPRLGQGWRPAMEPLRIGQEVSMAFAPGTVAALVRSSQGVPRLVQSAFGLLGPNGPLPLHLTDHARERILHGGDHTLARFADLLVHRQALLLYRAWAQGRPTVSLDRPQSDRHAAYVGSLMGVGEPAMQARDAVPDHAKLSYAGLFGAQARRAEGLEAILAGYFRLPMLVEHYVGHWLPLPEEERLRLGGRTAAVQLGRGAVAGGRVWDRQHAFRLVCGPLDLAEYESLLPGGTALPRLAALVRQYLNRELAWDARLVLRAEAVPRTRLGRAGRLGYTTWLGRWRRPLPAGNLLLDVERRVPLPGAAAG